jgi:phosphoenolpyruvate carboxylase
MRKIPVAMATQHPDNAFPPYWELRGDGFVSVQEEVDECASCFADLGIDEYMWDWEGKYADEAVIDKLLSKHFAYFQTHQVGKDRFLTFRLPNIWQEKGYSLARALMVVLTSEEFAQDLELHSPPLFEVILPMTERADQLLYIQCAFRDLAKFKIKTFTHRKTAHNACLQMIPLVESIKSQFGIGTILDSYLKGYKTQFGHKPEYMRVFLARSDPALMAGMVPNVLANKIALSEVRAISERHDVPMYPIIGAGSLPFRGGLRPDNIDDFLDEYRGVRTFTIQSAFRYDYPAKVAASAVRKLQSARPTRAVAIPDADREGLQHIAHAFEKRYRESLDAILEHMQDYFAAVPKRRERRQHTGLLGYKRNVGGQALPRAITFTAAFYSLGIPPEFLGGRALLDISPQERALLLKHYRHLRDDLAYAGKFLNRENLEELARRHAGWKLVQKDIHAIESVLNLSLRPRTKIDKLHKNYSANAMLLSKDRNGLARLITATARLRRSLG